MIFNTPFGSPASISISTRTFAVCGVSSAGLKTNVFPATSPGKIFHVGIAIGKFHGVMSPHTPTGTRNERFNLFGSSLGVLYLLLYGKYLLVKEQEQAARI